MDDRLWWAGKTFTPVTPKTLNMDKLFETRAECEAVLRRLVDHHGGARGGNVKHNITVATKWVRIKAFCDAQKLRMPTEATVTTIVMCYGQRMEHNADGKSPFNLLERACVNVL